jgi:heme/copper-type cytochrome/quinol oxidase subunit 2
LNSLQILVQETQEHTAHVTYPFPAFVFGMIAMGIFLTLAVVVWSYRDVANRHEHKGKNSNSGSH